MDSAEYIEWLAFYTLEDKETFEKLKCEVAIEDTRKDSFEQISDNVFNIFSQLGAINGSNK